ncbi:RNA polymerase sigma factor [Ramlibacter sp. PS4R-6]|uniref:RNA polymerase sigma factor n=1 Tax=Ramlibacter sp. PS4R-6 TaxID=3133438 RepID=UPI003099A1A0
MPDSAPDVREQLAALLPRLRRFGRALARNREDGDDLVQVALEKALARTDQWTPGTRLDSWMFRIMQNAWIDEVRARQRRGETFVDEEEAERAGAAIGDSQVDAVAVRKAVAQLSDEHRAVVALVLVEGLSYEEAAAVLEVPVGTLTSRLSRAREALKAMLGDAP